MPTPPPRRQTQPKPRISALFWDLSRDARGITESRDPDEVVRHLLAVLETLEGRCEHSAAAANALCFLLQLEDDPFYASPEQNRGGEKDSRALVYSIGVLLFERLTGHHPFVQSLSPLQSRVTRDRAHRLGSNNLCSLPSDLRGVLVRAMSPFAIERHRDVAELHADLELYLGRAETVIAPPPPSGPILRRALGSEPPVPAQFADGSQPKPVPRRRRRSAPPPCPGSADRVIFDMVQRSATRADTQAIAVGQAPRPSAPRTPLARDRRRHLPLAVGTGVFVVATCALVLLAASTVDHPTAVSAAAAATVVEPPPELSEAGEADEAERAIAALALSKPSTTASVPTRPDFDLERAAEQALENGRACFTAGRLGRGVQIDATLRFPASSASADKVYFASGQKLSRAERGCLSSAYTRASAGAAPDKTQLVTYTFWLSASTARHRVHRRR